MIIFVADLFAEQYRGGVDEPEPTMPGLFTGKRGEYVIYER